MKSHATLVCALSYLALGVVACGGGAAPGGAAKGAEAPPAAEGAEASSAARPAPAGGTGMEGQAAATNSDDVKRGISAMKGGDWNGARDAFEGAIKKNPKQADAHYYLGVVMEKTGDRASAERHYKDAVALDPNLDEANVNLMAIFVEDKKWDDAIAIAKRGIAKNGKNAAMHLNLAVALSGKGDEPGATKAFDEATRLEPNNAQYFLAYAQSLATWKKQPEAVVKLKQALAVAPQDAAVLGAIGFELRGLRAVPECIQAMDKALGVKDDPELRIIRGQCKMANKDKAGALADAQAAVAKDPSYAPARYWLGSWLGEDGKYKEATAEFQKYLELAPKGPMAEAAQKKIKLAKDKEKGGGGGAKK